jgi:hypothetical protein
VLALAGRSRLKPRVWRRPLYRKGKLSPLRYRGFFVGQSRTLARVRKLQANTPVVQFNTQVNLHP